MSETINGVSILSAETKRALVADVQFFETYTSAAFNRKMRGIVKPGFYAGFDAVLAGGLKINITSANESGKRGVASVDVGEYQISVQQVEDIGFTLPAGATTRVVLEANYQNGVKTNQVDSNSGIQAARLFLADVSVALAGNQLELCRFTVPAGTVNLTQAMLSKQNRPDKSIGIELSNDAEGSTTEGDAYKAATIAALKRALALSVQARGELPDTANLNKYGPTPDRVGQWSKSTVTGATIANGYPENDAIGVVEVSKAGASNGTQRFTLANGNVYTRSLTATWNGVDGPWGAWNAPYEEAPYPDVWIPFNDSLTMLAGSGPYDRINFGDQYAELTTRSVKFTRATTATYIDKSGVLQFAEINEPRFEKEGLLIEGQSANLIANSTSAASWQVVNTTVTAADIAGPDGTTGNVVRISAVGNPNAQTGSAINVPITNLTTGDYCAFSVFAKADTHSIIQLRWLGSATTGVTNRILNVNLLTGEMGPHTLAYAKVTPMANGWWRILAVTPIDGDLTGYVSADPGIELINSLKDVRRPLVSLAAGAGVYLYGPQLEAGYNSTSYIQTAGAIATRAADACTLQRAGNDNYYGQFTYSAVVHTNGPSQVSSSANQRRCIMAIYPSTTEWVLSYLEPSAGSTGKVRCSYGSDSYLQGAKAVDDGGQHRVTFSTNLTQNTVAVDGVISKGGTLARPVPVPTASSLYEVIYFGASSGTPSTNVRMLNGHIRDLRIWHSALNDNQIKGLR